MNTLKFLLPATLLISMACSAQQIHVSAGYNGSNVSKTSDDAWKGKAGFQFGGDVFIGHRWFLKPGLHYVSRNLYYSYTDAIDLSTQEVKYKSNSLAIPLMVGTYFMDPRDEPGFNMYVMGGPTALIGLSSEANNDQFVVKTNPAQWYLGFGAGAEFGILFFEGGYDVAMSNVFDGNDFDTNPKVNYLHAIAGIRLRLAN